MAGGPRTKPTPVGPRVTIVYLVQLNKYRWRLESNKGVIIMDDISAHSSYDAEKWVRGYVSSFACWEYRIKPQEENKDV